MATYSNSDRPTREGVSRRHFLAIPGLAVPAALVLQPWQAGSLLAADASATELVGKPTDLIVREAQPKNLEMPFAQLDSFITPTEQFYVRNHFEQPQLDARDWRLQVEGAVDKPIEFTYDDLRKLTAKTQSTLLECAGNGRAFLDPKTKGVQWQLGAVGNAMWTGVALADLLQKAGVRKTAVEVLLVGADSGELKDDPKPTGKVHFARSVPLQTALQPEVLLAYEMNGKPLPAEHGYPLRALVPGWYGMASIKWLTRVIVLERPFGGYFQTMQYSYFAGGDGLPSTTQIGVMNVKSQIARPAAGEKIAVGQKYRVFGAAWGGNQPIAKVDVSTNGGDSWQAATLLEKSVPYSWRLWEYTWTPSAPGKHALMARATDMTAREQPLERDPNRRNYLVNHVLPVEVTVE